MSNEYRDKLLSIGYTKGLTKPKVTETKGADGTRIKATENEAGTITEHSKPGTGVAFRQDALVKPETVYMKMKAS